MSDQPNPDPATGGLVRRERYVRLEPDEEFRTLDPASRQRSIELMREAAERLGLPAPHDDHALLEHLRDEWGTAGLVKAALAPLPATEIGSVLQVVLHGDTRLRDYVAETAAPSDHESANEAGPAPARPPGVDASPVAGDGRRPPRSARPAGARPALIRGNLLTRVDTQPNTC